MNASPHNPAAEVAIVTGGAKGIGFGIAAALARNGRRIALFDLDGPVRRLGALPSPVPYSPSLERSMLPDAEQIASALRAVATE